jgi:hypothetical protein
VRQVHALSVSGGLSSDGATFTSSEPLEGSVLAAQAASDVASAHVPIHTIHRFMLMRILQI